MNKHIEKLATDAGFNRIRPKVFDVSTDENLTEFAAALRAELMVELDELKSTSTPSGPPEEWCRAFNAGVARARLQIQRYKIK